jgi:hypothetical protein
VPAPPGTWPSRPGGGAGRRFAVEEILVFRSTFGENVTMGTLVVDADAEPRRASVSDRRLYGYALLAIALIAALCVPGLLGRRANGNAAPAPPAPPPTVGQCTGPIDRPEQLQQLTALPTVPCDRAHSAEIVFIGQFGAADSYPQDSAAAALIPANRSCAQQVEQFIGVGGLYPDAALAQPTAVIDPDRGVPHLDPRAAAVVAVPTRHQWNSGQRWYSCRVQPENSTLPISYLGSVRMAAQGPLPAAFALCAQVIGGDPVPCAEPHYAERLTDFIASENPLDCRQVARQLIGTQDPTFHGSLSLTAWRAAAGRAACWATSTSGQAFIGTLIDWGDRPLPTP